jgi:hypothetical protein
LWILIANCLPAAEPKVRQRLVLQPRSKPEEPAAPQASIFGGAKPVDTAAREKEIEERMEKEKEKGEISRLPARDTRSDDNRYGAGCVNSLSICVMGGFTVNCYRVGNVPEC